MNKVLLLMKNYFTCFFSRLFKNDKNKKATKAVLPIVLVVSILFVAFFSFLSYYSIISLKDTNRYLPIYSFSTTAIMFSLMIIATEGTAGGRSNDEEMLLALPIAKYQIILSKILYYFLFDLLIMVLLLFPSYIIYGVVVEDVSANLVARGFILIVCLSLFANGVSGILNTIFVRFTKKFKHQALIQSLLSLLLVIIFIIIYVGFTFVSQNAEFAIKIYDFYPIKLFSEFVIEGTISTVLIVLVISFLPFVLSVVLKTVCFGKTVNSYHSNDLELKFKQSSVSQSLLKKEINKYFSIPVYVTNTLIGLVFAIGILIVITIMGKENFVSIIQMVIAAGYENNQIPPSIEEMITGYFGYILMIACLFSVATTPITSCSISLEGKEMWILKAHPISEKSVFLAKIKAHVCINFFLILLISILMGINFGALYFIIGLIVLLCATVLSSIIGLYANLQFPKLDWESEMEPVKQGMSVLVTMMLNILFVIVPAIGFFFISGISTLIYLMVLVLIYLTLIFVWGFVLATKGVKLYRNI